MTYYQYNDILSLAKRVHSYFFPVGSMIMKTRHVIFAFFLSLVGQRAACWAAGGVSDTAAGGQFQKFFLAGGPLVWLVLLPLSVLSVVLIVQYFLLIRRSSLLPQQAAGKIREFLENGSFEPALDFLAGEGSLLSRIVQEGLTESKNGRVAMELAMNEMLEQETTGLFRKIEWLNIIGNVAPMIGLFGTVWGMINAFTGIVRAGGQPEPADLAGGISVALVTTWWGLVVAIPALAAYGSLRNRIDAISSEAAVVAEGLLRDIRPSTIRPAPHKSRPAETSV